MDADALLSRWGGYAAFGAVVAMVVGIASLVVPTGGQTYRFRDAAGSLAFAVDHQLLMAWFLWLGVLGFALLGITVLGLHARLRQASVPVVVATASAIIGLAFWVIWCVLWLGIVYDLAPAHAAVPAAEQPPVEAVAGGLVTIAHLFYALAAVGFFLGVVVLSVALLQTGTGPRWQGWVGIAAAVLAGLGGAAGQWLVAGFVVELVGWVVFLVWLVVVGFDMVRHPAALAPDPGR